MHSTPNQIIGTIAIAFAFAFAFSANELAIARTHDSSSALPLCGLSTNALGQKLQRRVVGVIEGSDAESRVTLKFAQTPAAQVSWVTDETKCQKAITALDKNWPTPHGGPVYLMQIGSDYAAVQGDRVSAANPAMAHLSSAFVFVAGIVWQ